MLPLHEHATSSGPPAVELAVAGITLGATMAYLVAAGRLRRRGDAWPVLRNVFFSAGGVTLVAAVLFPVPAAEFTAHMAQHLLVGMVSPLLMILGRPLTLVLRVLKAGPTRRWLLRLAHSRLVACLVFPPVAATIDVGGLWLLYRTGLFAESLQQPWLHAVVHLHVFASGLLFSFAICAVDPLRRRYGLLLRAASLVLAGAAHSILAKTLSAVAPPGAHLPAADLAQGAQLMYYGGDLVEIALALCLALQWYAATERASVRLARRETVSTPPAR